MSRPELIAPPEIFYNENEAKKYAQSSHLIQTQTKLAERCIELLALPVKKSTSNNETNIPDWKSYDDIPSDDEFNIDSNDEESEITEEEEENNNFPALILDIGCGTCLGGEVLSHRGYDWIGCDISSDMIAVALSRQVDGDIIHVDIGNGLNFRPGCFDGAISISALQWLCNADKNHHIPHKRLIKFFTSLYSCLKIGGKAVFQCYPAEGQMEIISYCATKSGFTGGWVTDYPNSTKAKKHYLCLCAGVVNYQPPSGYDENDENQCKYDLKRKINNKNIKKKKFKNENSYKSWVLKKKKTMSQRGKKVCKDSKYTGRKRRPGASYF